MVQQATQPTAQASSSRTQTQPTLTLRAPQTLVLQAEPAEERHIQWAEEVIDNEGMGKKSSKVCCIYHKPRGVDDSSSDDSSSDSSSDDSDSGADDGRARPIGGGDKRGRKHKHHHDHDHGNEEGCADGAGNAGGTGKGKGRAKERKASPNAYEKMPKYGKKKDEGATS